MVIPSDQCSLYDEIGIQNSSQVPENYQRHTAGSSSCALAIQAGEDQQFESMTSLRIKAATPTSFTLLGQDGINKATGPSVLQIVGTVCVCVLVGIVGAIVYMEVFMRSPY